MGGVTIFLVGALIAVIAIGAWGFARWRTARGGGGRRW
ncbi:hypothetical protein BH18ACT12_BH18ACT12_06940 [soil metagenome]